MTIAVHRLGRSLRIRGVLLAVLTSVGLLALPAAAARADDTWTGESSSSAWSNASNWTTGVPSGSAGTLTFPTLAGCGTCYTSANDVSGISATGLVLSNTTGQYRISGDGLTVGPGGISYRSGGSTSDVIGAPLTLAAPQTWTIGKPDGYNSLSLPGPITGPDDSLGVAFPAGGPGDLFVDSKMEVGPVTVSGAGGLHIGGPPGSGMPGSVNASDGSTVTIHNGARLVANPDSQTGPLTITNGNLLLGTNSTNTGATTLAVDGGFSIDSASTTTTFIDDSGSTPGADFSQLSATGNIALAGQLVIGQGSSTSGCATLTQGDVAVLLRTTGTLSGTFAGVPDGTVLSMNGGSCQTPTPLVRINYTPNSVIATVLNGPAPPTSATQQGPTISARTSRAVRIGTRQATLTGSVSPGGAAVSWMFEFGRDAAHNRSTQLRAIAAGPQRTVSVSAVVKRLSPNVRYHYRLVVLSPASGSTAARGASLTFTTRAMGRLLGPSSRLAVFGLTILLPQRCQSSVLCAGKFSLTTTLGKRKTVACATGGFRIKAHHGATARPRISARCFRLLKTEPHHRLTVRYAAQSQTGQAGLRRRIKLVLRSVPRSDRHRAASSRWRASQGTAARLLGGVQVSERPREIAISPVRAISIRPNGRMSRSNASTLS